MNEWNTRRNKRVVFLNINATIHDMEKRGFRAEDPADIYERDLAVHNILRLLSRKDREMIGLKMDGWPAKNIARYFKISEDVLNNWQQEIQIRVKNELPYSIALCLGIFKQEGMK